LEAFDRQPLPVQGDAYDGSVGQTNADEVALTGGNVVGRWTHTFSDDSDLQIQTYYDRTDRDVPPILLPETLHTFDIDARHRVSAGPTAGHRLGRKLTVSRMIMWITALRSRSYLRT